VVGKIVDKRGRFPCTQILEKIYEIPGHGTTLSAMEGLRAYAALLIFAVHYCDPYIRSRYQVDPNTATLGSSSEPGLVIAQIFFASHYGVDIFFVLSGFLICRMVSQQRFRFTTFIARRLLRIYPAALLSVLGWAFYRIEMQSWYQLEVTQFAGNLLFLNAVPALEIAPYNTVTWTLFFELLFYATFPLILLTKDPNAPITPLRVILFGGIVCVAVQPLGYSFVRFPMFFAGALLASLNFSVLRKVAATIPGWLVIGAYVASICLFAATLDYRFFIPIFMVTCSLLVVHVLFGEGKLSRLFSARPIRYLGNISYSFYLTHTIGIEIVMYRYHEIFLGLPWVAYLLVTIGLSLTLSVLFATLLFVVAERPYFAMKGAVAPRQESVTRKASG
jgi:peptidoglycan/LPS O-acetylase OafA/YrhL